MLEARMREWQQVGWIFMCRMDVSDCLKEYAYKHDNLN